MIFFMLVNLSFVIWATNYIANDVFTGQDGTYDKFKFYLGMYTSFLFIEGTLLIPLLIFA